MITSGLGHYHRHRRHGPDWINEPGGSHGDADAVEQEGERHILQHLAIAAPADLAGAC